MKPIMPRLTTEEEQQKEQQSSTDAPPPEAYSDDYSESDEYDESEEAHSTAGYQPGYGQPGYGEWDEGADIDSVSCT